MCEGTPVCVLLFLHGVNCQVYVSLLPVFLLMLVLSGFILYLCSLFWEQKSGIKAVHLSHREHHILWSVLSLRIYLFPAVEVGN